MNKICVISGREFSVTDTDLKFYEKMRVSVPKLCPEERQRRRLAWRNERKLYYRNCDATGKKMLSIYPTETLCKKVFSPQAYWADDWNALDYGRDFDFTRPFFEQFFELYYEVPHLGLILKEHENSEFCNDAIRLKNCYLVFDGEQARDCMYGETFMIIQDCLDFLFLTSSELSYECVNCRNVYKLFFSYNCRNCSEAWFLRDCIGCKNCFGCSNLHQKSYYIYNKPYSKAEYEQFIVGFPSGSHSVIMKLKKNADKFLNSQFVKYFAGIQNENCTGDHIFNCKDSEECFDCNNLQNCKFCSNMQMGASDCYDVNIFGNATERIYNSIIIGEGAQNVICSHTVAFGVENIAYSAFCWQDSKDLFGCVGLIHKQYCILNKQYSKEDYLILREKIIQHMRKTGEWGEFFPIEYSPFAYNDTVANEYFPLTEQDIVANGWKWKDETLNTKYQGARFDIPDAIEDVTDDILNKILDCEVCGKNFRLVKPELAFYRKMKLPIPRKCPNCRHLARMKVRNPRKLYNRTCDNCKAIIQTTFSINRPEKIYCEKCYLNSIN